MPADNQTGRGPGDPVPGALPFPKTRGWLHPSAQRIDSVDAPTLEQSQFLPVYTRFTPTRVARSIRLSPDLHVLSPIGDGKNHFGLRVQGKDHLPICVGVLPQSGLLVMTYIEPTGDGNQPTRSIGAVVMGSNELNTGTAVRQIAQLRKSLTGASANQKVPGQVETHIIRGSKMGSALYITAALEQLGVTLISEGEQLRGDTTVFLAIGTNGEILDLLAISKQVETRKDLLPPTDSPPSSSRWGRTN